MNLKKQDQEFRNPKLFYPDPKNIDLDRVMINFFILLRCNGSRPVSRGRARAAVEQVITTWMFSATCLGSRALGSIDTSQRAGWKVTSLIW